MMRRVPMGQAARRRIRAGGPRAQGRPAASTTQWTAICELVKARAGWRCQACGLRTRLDVHHVVKRAQGGSDLDPDNLVALCRACHDQTDAPFSKGRLVVTILGGAVFTFDRIWAASKWAARRAIGRSVSGVRLQHEVAVRVEVVLVADHDIHLPHLIPARVGHQSTTRVSLVGSGPDDAFALKKLLKFTSPQVLKAERREKAPHVADLVLSPDFDAERSPVGKPAFGPPDIERVVFRRLRDIGPTV